MKLSNQARVGILSIAAIILLVIGFNYLKGSNLFNKGKDYKILYPNNPGLNIGDPVNINGVNTGRVTNVEFNDFETLEPVVTINIVNDIKIPDDSRAIIKNDDLLGEKSIQIIMGISNQYLKSNDFIVGEIQTNLAGVIQEQLKPVTEKMQSMLVSIDTAITVISSIFTPDFKTDFKRSLENIKGTLESFNTSAYRMDNLLARAEPEIEGIISGVSSITQNVDSNKATFIGIVENLRLLTDSLNQIDWKELSEEIDDAINSVGNISDKINNGEGTMGKLINDETLYNELVETLNALDTAVTKISQDPEIRLRLFGGKKKNTE